MAVTNPSPILTTTRLISILFFVAVLFTISTREAGAEDTLKTQGYIHRFSNDIAVGTAVFSLNKDFTLETSASFKYTVDFINPELLNSFGVSGASGTSSSGGGGDDGEGEGDDDGGGVSETRHEITLGVTQVLPYDFTVALFYDFSTESDFVSHTPTVTLKKDLFEKNTTLSLGFSKNFETVSGKFMGREEDRDTNNYFLGITQILSPVALVYAGYSGSEVDGHLSEGIRLVALGATSIDDCSQVSSGCASERFPDSRSRKAYILGMNYYLDNDVSWILDRSSVKLKFRYYDDDWDISSYMAEVKYYKYLTERGLIRLLYRFYDQSEAYFNEANYIGSEQFLTSSPQHLKLSTHLAGVKYSQRLTGLSFINIDGEPLIEGKYEYYNESTGISAHIFMFSAKFNF